MRRNRIRQIAAAALISGAILLSGCAQYQLSRDIFERTLRPSPVEVTTEPTSPTAPTEPSEVPGATVTPATQWNPHSDYVKSLEFVDKPLRERLEAIERIPHPGGIVLTTLDTDTVLLAELTGAEKRMTNLQLSKLNIATQARESLLNWTVPDAAYVLPSEPRGELAANERWAVWQVIQPDGSQNGGPVYGVEIWAVSLTGGGRPRRIWRGLPELPNQTMLPVGRLHIVGDYLYIQKGTARLKQEGEELGPNYAVNENWYLLDLADAATGECCGQVLPEHEGYFTAEQARLSRNQLPPLALPEYNWVLAIENERIYLVTERGEPIPTRPEEKYILHDIIVFDRLTGGSKVWQADLLYTPLLYRNGRLIGIMDYAAQRTAQFTTVLVMEEPGTGRGLCIYNSSRTAWLRDKHPYFLPEKALAYPLVTDKWLAVDLDEYNNFAWSFATEEFVELTPWSAKVKWAKVEFLSERFALLAEDGERCWVPLD